MQNDNHGFFRLIDDIFAADTSDSMADVLSYDAAKEILLREAPFKIPLEQLLSRYPGLDIFLQINPDEKIEYLLLVDMLAAEVIPDLDIPKRPLSQAEPTEQTWVDKLINLLSPRFLADAALAHRRNHGQLTSYAPIEIMLPDSDVTLRLALQPSEADEQKYDLLLMTDAEDDWLEGWEGTLLQLEANNMVMQTVEVDEFGDAIFETLIPDTYQIRWLLAGTAYHIQDLLLP